LQRLSALASLAVAGAMCAPQAAHRAPLTVMVLGADGTPVRDAVVSAVVRGQRSSNLAAAAQIAQRERQ